MKTHLFKFSKKYQEYSNVFHVLLLHLKKTMLKNRFEIHLKRKLEKWTRRFEHKETLFEKNEKFSKFDSKRVKKRKSSTNSLTSMMMTTMCRMRSIETSIKIKIKIKIVNIAKIDVVKTKFRAEKRKNLKIRISLIFQK